jgi:hypothetical protein
MSKGTGNVLSPRLAPFSPSKIKPLNMSALKRDLE